MPQQKANLDELVNIMATLRGPGGCPWDRKQTVQTIKDYLLEECYEAYDAAAREDFDELADELGDVLFEVVFLSRLAQEAGRFDISLPIRLVADKLIRRHPHVFGDHPPITEADDVLTAWQAVKRTETKSQERKSQLDGVSPAMPPLLQAYRLGQRAASMGFDWPDAQEVMKKVDEELGELKDAMAHGEPPRRLEEELGDLLFSLTNLARHLKIAPHDSLLSASRKFRRRFGFMEEMAAARNLVLEDLDMDALEDLWRQAKDRE